MAYNCTGTYITHKGKELLLLVFATLASHNHMLYANDHLPDQPHWWILCPFCFSTYCGTEQLGQVSRILHRLDVLPDTGPTEGTWHIKVGWLASWS